MFPSTLLATLTLLLTLSATALAGAGLAPDGGSRLGLHHRFAKRASKRQWGPPGGQNGGGSQHGGPGGSKPCKSKSKTRSGSGGKSSATARSSLAAAGGEGWGTTTTTRWQTSSRAATTKTTTSSKAATTTSSSSGSTYSGEATFYYQEGAYGACGDINSDSAKIVALQSNLYSSSYCGKSLTITNTANGKSVTATVADECPGCSSTYSLDLSTGAFDAIGDEDTGVLGITWSWN